MSSFPFTTDSGAHKSPLPSIPLCSVLGSHFIVMADKKYVETLHYIKELEASWSLPGDSNASFSNVTNRLVSSNRYGRLLLSHGSTVNVIPLERLEAEYSSDAISLGESAITVSKTLPENISSISLSPSEKYFATVLQSSVLIFFTEDVLIESSAALGGKAVVEIALSSNVHSLCWDENSPNETQVLLASADGAYTCSLSAGTTLRLPAKSSSYLTVNDDGLAFSVYDAEITVIDKYSSDDPKPQQYRVDEVANKGGQFSYTLQLFANPQLIHSFDIFDNKL